jgi:hypothetical protein
MRGYQKKVIHLKNPGSAMFEEAFFVLKDEDDSYSEADSVIREANRIIEENTVMRDRTVRGRLWKKSFLLLFLSALTVCAFIVICKFI